MIGKTIHHCSQCEYKTTRRWDRDRHFQKIHAKNVIQPQQNKIKAPSPNQMEIPEVKPLNTNQVYHTASDQHQQVIGNKCYSSHGETEKFDRIMHNQDNQQYGCETESKCFKEEYFTLQNDHIRLLRENQKLKEEYSSLEQNFTQYNDKRMRSSQESTDKFNRFYQAVHRKKWSVNQSQEGKCTRRIGNKIATVNNRFSMKWRKLVSKKNLPDSIRKIISKYLNNKV